jgi:outer membrane protein TolC
VLFLLQDLAWKKNSLEFARGLLKRNEDLVRGGFVAPVSIAEARAGVAVREEAMITAESELKKFEDRLKLLLHVDIDRTELSLSDPLRRELVAVNLQTSLERALKNRPEIAGLQFELEQREIERKFASNQTLPRLDLAVQYGMNGLSGRPNQTCIDPTIAVCVPVGTNVNGSIFEGQTRAQDAFNRFFKNPFDNWSVELKLQIPIFNRTANAQLSEANLRYAETQSRQRALREQIETEVREAVRSTLAADKRIDAARETSRYVEEQLDGGRRKFEAGLGTTYDVLQILEDLDKSKTSEARAMMDFAVGQSKLRLAEGTTLEKYHIELAKPPRYKFQ